MEIFLHQIKEVDLPIKFTYTQFLGNIHTQISYYQHVTIIETKIRITK